MEVRVAGTGAGPAGHRPGGHELAARGVEAEHERRVEALVGDDEKAPARLEDHVVRMRARLLGAMRSGLAAKREDVGHSAQRAIGFDRQHRQRPARVVRDHGERVGGVDTQAHAVATFRRLSVQQRETPTVGIDRVGHGFGAVAVRRIETSPLAIDGQPRRVDHALEHLLGRPLAGLRVDPIGADPFAVTVALLGRIAADVGEHRSPPRGHAGPAARSAASGGDRCREAGGAGQELSPRAHGHLRLSFVRRR